jgi:hypothetical protein
MKLLFCTLFTLLLAGGLKAQEFAKQLTTARSSYSGGKLEDARFAMQQMMVELDILTGKDIMALLPPKLDTISANAAKDNVSGSSGFAGVIIHREYGMMNQNGGTEPRATVEIITNSPMISTLNSLLSLPFIANNQDQKVIKINGYKALVQKISGTDNQVDYEMQLPLNATLITLKAPGYSQDKLIAMANSLPIQEIAKTVQ